MSGATCHSDKIHMCHQEMKGDQLEHAVATCICMHLDRDMYKAITNI